MMQILCNRKEELSCIDFTKAISAEKITDIRYVRPYWNMYFEFILVVKCADWIWEYRADVSEEYFKQQKYHVSRMAELY